jgi:hypothetical protein
MTPSETADRICGSVADLVSLANVWQPIYDPSDSPAAAVAADLLTTANAVLGHGGAA